MRAILLQTPEFDVFGHMALDEAVFSHAEPDALVLRFYRWLGGLPESGLLDVPRAVTFGYFQANREVVQDIRGRGLPLTFPVVRRLTGGGIVYHDGDLTYSMVFPWSRLVPAMRIYEDMHHAVHLGLKSFNIPSRLWPVPGGRVAASTACFKAPSPMDLVHENGSKFLGGALRRRNGIGLYQGSLRIEGFSVGRRSLAEAVIEGLGLKWKVIFVPKDVEPDILREAARLRKKRYNTDHWNQRR